MKTNELTGAALDWAVAKCERYLEEIRLNRFKEWEDIGRTQVCDDVYTLYSPSTDWAQGGPIIEREKIKLMHADGCGWFAYCGVHNAEDPAPLIAAMRCYVASKLGDDIEVLKGLL